MSCRPAGRCWKARRRSWPATGTYSAFTWDWRPRGRSQGTRRPAFGGSEGATPVPSRVGTRRLQVHESIGACASRMPLPAAGISGFVRIGVGHQRWCLLVLDHAPVFVSQAVVCGCAICFVGSGPFALCPRMVGDNDDALLWTHDLSLG